MHGRSISSSRKIWCVRLLQRTARDGCARYEGLASRRPVRLQRVLRRRNLVSGTGNNVGAALPIGLAQGFIVLAFAVVVMLAVI
jgi:hypothetical protein